MRRLVVAAALCLIGAAHGQGVPGQGTWETTLQARDIDGNGSVDAYYDTDLHITWLADANYAAQDAAFVAFQQATNFEAGLATVSMYRTWASGLDVGGVTGWRLTQTALGAQPCSLRPASDPSVPVCSATAASELTHLFGVTLAQGALFNTGPFLNLTQSMQFVAGNDVDDTFLGRRIYFYNDRASDEQALTHGWAVHDGDIGVPPIPEPSTYALFLIGLACLVFRGRRGMSFHAH